MIEIISVVWMSSSVGSIFAPVDVMLKSDLAATRALRVSREPRVQACAASNVVVEKVSTSWAISAATCTFIGPLVREEPWEETPLTVMKSQPSSVANSVEANSVAQSQSEAYPGAPMHVFANCCASAKLTIKRRKMRASRGAAPKRTTELRQAES